MHELYVSSESEKKRLTLEMADQSAKVAELEAENARLRDTGRKTQQETFLLKQENDEARANHERLSRELFEGKDFNKNFCQLFFEFLNLIWSLFE